VAHIHPCCDSHQIQAAAAVYIKTAACIREQVYLIWK